MEKVLGEFRPLQKGLGKVLGHLESAVMEIMWQIGRGSVRDVHELLLKERRIAYTTVMTIMSRLADKGLLAKEKEGAAYFYTPVHSREEFASSIVKRVVDGLLEDYAEATFAHFVKRLQGEDVQKLQQLERLIEQRRREGEV